MISTGRNVTYNRRKITKSPAGEIEEIPQKKFLASPDTLWSEETYGRRSLCVTFMLTGLWRRKLPLPESLGDFINVARL